MTCTGMICKSSLQRGFTLLELMVALTISAVLLAVAIPSFRDSSLRSTLTVQSNDLVSAALLARSEAIKRRAAVSLCSSTDNATCTNSRWEAGWIIRATDGTVILIHKAAPSGFLINASAKNISFASSGLAASLTTLTVCRSNPSPGRQERSITINATGKSSITKTTTGVCVAS